MSTSGRWLLEKLGVYLPYSGVTSNQSECFNSVLKRIQSWREVPVDAIVLALYHLQAFYHNEVQRGFSGLGDYCLLPEFSSAKRSPDEIDIIPTFPPEEIVSKIKERVSTTVTECTSRPSLSLSQQQGTDTEAPATTQQSRAR